MRAGGRGAGRVFAGKGGGLFFFFRGRNVHQGKAEGVGWGPFLRFQQDARFPCDQKVTSEPLNGDDLCE